MKKFILIFLLLNISSCSNTKSSWDCPILGAGDGNCRSIKRADLIHKLSENNNNQFSEIPSKINIKLTTLKTENVNKNKTNKEDQISDSKPLLRTEEKIGRVWFAPFIDSDGNQHSQKIIYVVDEQAKWMGQND